MDLTVIIKSKNLQKHRAFGGFCDKKIPPVKRVWLYLLNEKNV
jgi:hypothetical protein